MFDSDRMFAHIPSSPSVPSYQHSPWTKTPQVWVTRLWFYWAALLAWQFVFFCCMALRSFKCRWCRHDRPTQTKSAKEGRWSWNNEKLKIHFTASKERNLWRSLCDAMGFSLRCGRKNAYMKRQDIQAIQSQCEILQDKWEVEICTTAVMLVQGLDMGFDQVVWYWLFFRMRSASSV